MENLEINKLREEFLKYIKSDSEEDLKNGIRDIISRYGRTTNMGGYSLDFLTGQMYIYLYTIFVEYRNEFQKIKQEISQSQKKEDTKDEIKFLEIILKSNKNRKDCLIHMVKGRLSKLKKNNKIKE